MHFKKILELYGCTNARWREILTSKGGAEGQESTPEQSQKLKDNIKIRKRIEERVSARIHDGLCRSLKRASAMEAIDMAWDAPPIQNELIPLMMWASGRISKEAITKAISDNTRLTAYTTLNKDGQVQVNLPKIFEISISLVRSYVTRRHASQATKYANLWPFFKYEPRGTDDVSNLQADALSQVVEKMSDDYNYRHFFPQTDRDKLLYGFSLVFPRQAWSESHAYRPKGLNVDTPLTKDDVESYVYTQGIDPVNPHPGRSYWDSSAPLPNINTNNGPRWVGFWDMCKFSDLATGSNYFNLESVSHGEKFTSLLNAHRTFFDFYFDPTVIKLPDATGPSPADANDRSSLIGQYAGKNADNGVLYTQHFEQINPKEEGIANYDLPVWVRFTVMGDGTIVGAEWLPSIPAVYGGFNQHDGRERSVSYAEELLPYQDQLTNLCTQMLFNIRTSMVQLWLLDKDSLEPDTVKYFEDGAKTRDFLVEPKILTYSMAKLKELGIQDPRTAFTVVQAQASQTIESTYQAMMRLLGIIDRLANVSNNEMGASNPREISATEAQEISSTTATMHTFISDGIDEQRAAMKRLIYESFVSFGPDKFEAPVVGRYSVEAIKEAGFKPARGDLPEDGILPSKTKITGNVAKLIYSYAYDSRDGAERSSNPQAAQLLVQMAQMLMGSEQLVQAMGKRRLYSLLNTIVRLSGAGWDLKLEMDPNEEDSIGSSDELKQLAQRVQQIEQMLNQLLSPPAPAGASPGGAPAAPADESLMLQPAPAA